jgi:2-iminoacetate synthase
MKTKEIFDPEKNEYILENIQFNENEFFGILEKARGKKGLSLEEVAVLIKAPREYSGELFKTAAFIRKEIYGNRMVLFAPLYCSSYCVNRCAYCAFQAQNASNKRIKLTEERVKIEALSLLNMGHKRTLLECGEDSRHNSIDYILNVIDWIYNVTNLKGDSIRRVNVNIAATTVENYRKLVKVNIGTYNLFQETYHRKTYEKVHPRNTPKGNYSRQLFAMNRAIEGGLQDLGMGVLYGLYDWRFEILALISHARYLDKNFGIGPHAISFPRIKKAQGVDFIPPYPVSDDDFLKLIAIIRVAIPYSGMVISTRESPEIRLKAFRIGISQASAASSAVPGGYGCPNKGKKMLDQFSLNDHRTLDDVTYELLRNGFIPSHCTACEYKGRMGKTFLPVAKSGKIKKFCQPNALITLKEYLTRYASDTTREVGNEFIENELRSFLGDNTLLRKCIEDIGYGSKEYNYF